MVSPILSANGTPTYNLSQFLVELLNNTISSEFTLKNSYEFVNRISSFKDANQYIMASFDIVSLFTNIPVNETIKLILDKHFPNINSTFHNFNRKDFETFLNLSLKNTNFFFNNKLYTQIDGLGMGLPCAPTLANLFLSHHESIWLNNCPLDFKPVFYNRYVDDTFLLFKNYEHIDLFLNYLNAQHNNIKFTKELEVDNSLPFLDVLITKVDNRFQTGIYRKPTFTGLGSNYFSCDSFLFKINSIQTLVYRAYHLSSNLFNFHKEVTFLKNFFKDNSFPVLLVEKCIKKFLNKIYTTVQPIQTVPKKIVYVSFPYLDYMTGKLKNELVSILNSRFPQLNVRLVFTNKNSIASLFRHKEKLPNNLRSNIIYKFECESCKALYFGSTTRHFKSRIAEHLGVSIRTGNTLSSPTYSAIREHSENSNHPMSFDNFTSLKSINHNILTMESLYINKYKPKLNGGLPVELSVVP